MGFEAPSGNVETQGPKISSAEAKKQYEGGEMKAEDYIRTLRPEDLKSQYVIRAEGDESKPVGDASASIEAAKPVEGSAVEAKKTEKVEKPAGSKEKAAEKTGVEAMGDRLKELDKGIESMKGTLEYFKSKGNSAENSAVIAELSKEIENAERDKEKTEMKYKVASLEKRVSELEKMIKEGKTGELGLTEGEAKKAADEMKEKTKKPSPEKVAKPEKAAKTEKGAKTEKADKPQGDAKIEDGENQRDGFGSEGEYVDWLENGRPSAKVEGEPVKKAETASETKTGEAAKAEDASKQEAAPEKASDGNKKELLPSAASGIFKETYEKQVEQQKGKSKWGWIKERLKGLVTVGFWEFHQAERFRTKTKETAGDINTDAKKIQQTEVLDLNSALEEAGRMKEMSAKEGKEGVMSKDDMEKYSEAITEAKKQENSALINTMINQSTANLEKQLAKYKDEYGDSAVTVEKLDAFRTRLRTELEALQRGFLFKEELDGAGELAKSRPSRVREAILANPDTFKRTVRESLDPKYWKRYVYGGAEMALWATAGAISTYNYLYGGKTAAEATAAKGAGVATKKAGVEGARMVSENMNMHDTIWKTSKEWLQQNGISNPSNSEIMNVSKQVAIDNHIGVDKWGVPGSPMDTQMGQGHLLKFWGATGVLNGIRSTHGLANIVF